MKKNVSVLSIAYFTFILLIILSAGLDGIVSDAMYYLAFILPIFAVILFTDREAPKMCEFSLTEKAEKILFPTVFPAITLIAAISIATTLLISLFGGAPAKTDVGSDLITALCYYALLPSILEEMLFRYLPMRYIAPYSKRYAVLFSAVFFSLAHHSFFSIPYALFAGALFMTVDLLCESCLPSMMLHFVNNAVSVLWMMYFGETFSVSVLFAVLLVPCAVSLFVIFKRRRLYLDGLSEIFSDKGERVSPLPMIFAAFISILAAVLETLG